MPTRAERPLAALFPWTAKGAALIFVAALLIDPLDAGVPFGGHHGIHRADVCADAAHRLLAADTVVALEREKYLLDAMRCDVGRRLRELRPAQR